MLKIQKRWFSCKWLFKCTKHTTKTPRRSVKLQPAAPAASPHSTKQNRFCVLDSWMWTPTSILQFLSPQTQIWNGRAEQEGSFRLASLAHITLQRAHVNTVLNCSYFHNRGPYHSRSEVRWPASRLMFLSTFLGNGRGWRKVWQILRCAIKLAQKQVKSEDFYYCKKPADGKESLCTSLFQLL